MRSPTTAKMPGLGDPKHLGARFGLTVVLRTWGSPFIRMCTSSRRAALSSPASPAAINRFDSIDAAQAWRNSDQYKEARKLGVAGDKRKAPLQESPRQRPESAAKPPFDCDRAIAFTALSRDPQPQGHTSSPRNSRPTHSQLRAGAPYRLGSIAPKPRCAAISRISPPGLKR